MKSELEFHLKYDMRHAHSEKKKKPGEGIYSIRHHIDCIDTFPSALEYLPAGLPALLCQHWWLTLLFHTHSLSRTPSAQLVQNCQDNVHSHLNPDHVNLFIHKS